MNQFLFGFNHLIIGFGLITKPGLRRYIFIPMLLNIIIFTFLFLGLRHYTGEFNAWFNHYLPAWLHWLSYLLWLLFFVSFFLGFLYTFVTVGNIVSAPFNSFLAEKVQYQLTGQMPATNGFWHAIKTAPRSMGRQIAILMYYVPRAILLLLLFFIPVVQVVAPLLWLAFNAWYMLIIYMDYPMDNNHVSFNAARKWLAINRVQSAGLGVAMLIASLIPGINLLSIPASVAAATKILGSQREEMIMSRQKIACVVMGMMWMLLATAGFALEAKANENFLTLADIHFTPFINCKNTKPCLLIKRLNQAPANQWASLLKADNGPFSAYREDTSYSLLVSALTAAKATANNKHAQFVLVLGDTLAHDYQRLYKYYSGDNSTAGYQSFVRKTYQFVNAELADTFPVLDVYMMVGNNDSYRGDYATQVQGNFFKDEGVLWSSLIKNSANRIAMRRDFSNMGYYAAELPSNVRLIVLNTNLFSSKARGKDLPASAMAQLKWLHDQLVDVKNKHQQAFIAMHIPEGVDVYATLRIHGIFLVAFWRSEYIDSFQNDMHEFAPQVSAIFAGHLHSDWLQILRYENVNDIPVTGTPSISPVFGNNPGYKIYTYSEAEKKLADFVTYYLNLNNRQEWAMEYEFNHIYQPNCHNCSIAAGINLIHKRGYLSDYYKLFYAVKTDSQPIGTQWNPYYWCAIWHVQPDSYKTCLG